MIIVPTISSLTASQHWAEKVRKKAFWFWGRERWGIKED
jgi:hypothetical protein